jgi:multidrug resistance efflux pump
VGSATYVFTLRQGQAVSVSAHVEAQTYDVGADYAGVVIRRFVEPGDAVAAGDPLFVIASLQVARDVSTGALTVSNNDVTEDGELTVRASISGTVKTLDVNEGAYVAAGVPVATIERDQSLSATAVFVLAPRDFSRIEDNATVDLILPNGRVAQGTVSSLSVQTIDGDAHVTVKISTDELIAGADNGLVQDGTPLEARLHLRQDGVFAGMQDAADDLLRRLGIV